MIRELRKESEDFQEYYLRGRNTRYLEKTRRQPTKS